MFAVIETGGKQYRVASGQKLKIEKLDGEAGTGLTFDKVLLTTDGEKVIVGTPYLEGVKVEATVLAQAQAKKIIVFKYKNKTRQAKKKGHRQPFTKVQITKITG